MQRFLYSVLDPDPHASLLIWLPKEIVENGHLVTLIPPSPFSIVVLYLLRVVLKIFVI
jgi:hypothetical protein